MAEAAPKKAKYKLVTAKYTRYEGKELKRYVKGDVIELAEHEVKAFGDKFEPFIDQKTEVAKGTVLKSDAKGDPLKTPASGAPAA